LVDVWTYLIVTEVEGFRYAFVGSIYMLIWKRLEKYVDDIVETWPHRLLIVLGALRSPFEKVL
jgi:hypothetical protein